MNETYLALDALLTRYINLFSDTPHSSPYVEFESEWLSECVLAKGNKPGAYFWKPEKRQQQLSFSELEKALEISFPKDLIDFYGSFWSNGICVERDDINFSLIQIWNDEDEQHLKENILGHVFAKIKAKLPLTFFIGSTFGDEVICLDQETGNVVLEKPGYAASRVLSPDLPGFLISLQPLKDSYS
tara:strand:- start:4472 stop:5029 length:558 start_codon:yes stop_codon:yes gene_type:complete